MHITLHLTNDCNLRCDYCYAPPGNLAMSFETAQKAIKLTADATNVGIIFFGGEPLLHKELIFRVIDWANEYKPRHFHYKVTTNGTLLDEPFIDKADERSLAIAMSHDGVKIAHDAHRKFPDGQGSFDLVDERLSLLLNRRPYAPVMLCVNPNEVEHYSKSVKHLFNRGAKYLICSLNYAGNWNDDNFSVLREQYEELAGWYLEILRAEEKVYFSPFDKRIASHIRPGFGNSCKLGKRQLSIGPDGGVYPCVQFVGHEKFKLGEVSTGIDQSMRQSLYEGNECGAEICKPCALNARCHCKCGCLNFQVTGDYRTIPPILCEYERMLIPIADRVAETLYGERNPLFIQRHYNSLFPILSFLEDIAGV